jgi:hypothetical protein
MKQLPFHTCLHNYARKPNPTVAERYIGLYAHCYSHGTIAIIMSTLNGDRNESKCVDFSGKIDRAIDTTPVKIQFKEPHSFPSPETISSKA